MRATLRSRVVPRLSRAAHRRATAPFLEELTLIVPLRRVPPVTRRWVGLAAPIVTRSALRAALMRVSMSTDRFWPPDSIRAMADWVVPRFSASWAWVMRFACRAERMRAPISEAGAGWVVAVVTAVIAETICQGPAG